MSDGSFADFITRDRERLHAERVQIFNQQTELKNKLDEINREFAAIEAYEAAKTSKAPAAAQQPRGGRARPQARRGSKCEALMQVIKDNPSGLILVSTAPLNGYGSLRIDFSTQAPPCAIAPSWYSRSLMRENFRGQSRPLHQSAHGVSAWRF